MTYVFTADRKSARVSQIDHRVPLADGGETTEENLVVACLHCNSTRGRARPSFDKKHPLWAVPEEPFYSENTAKFLAKHLGIKVPASSARSTDLEPVRPGSQPGTAISDPTTGGVPLPTPRVSKDRAAEIKVISVDSEGVGSGFTGSGLVGSGLAGTGRAGSGRARRTGRRGRRGSRSGSNPSVGDS